jgi:hypothetical protein
MNWYSRDELLSLVGSIAFSEVQIAPRIGSDRDGETFSMGHEIRAVHRGARVVASFDRVGVGAEVRACWAFGDDDPPLTMWLTRKAMRGPPVRPERHVSTGWRAFDETFVLECLPRESAQRVFDRGALERILTDDARSIALESFAAHPTGDRGVPGISGWVRTAARADAIASGFDLVLELRKRILADHG